MRPIQTQHSGVHPGQGIQPEELEDHPQVGQAHLRPPHVRQVILFPVQQEPSVHNSTSGCRNPRKAREMEQQIRNRQVLKEYVCRVEGEFPE